MKTKQWSAGTELRAAPPPPPPGPPPHMHGQIPPHVAIAEGIEVVSAQVAELQTTVEGLQAAVDEVRSAVRDGGSR